MSQNKVQQRARAKRDQERMRRKQQERMRKIRIWATVASVIALTLIAILVFSGKSTKKTALTSPTPSSSGIVSAKDDLSHPCGSGAPPSKLCYSHFPVRPFDATATYTADVQTSLGNFTLALDAKHAPKTVNSFVFLAQRGFYDGLIFHRVIPGFMIQGGDPTGDGTGSPGYKFDNENTAPAFGAPGVLAMANSGANTNGSQFFITVAPAKHLNGSYNVFGTVTKGMEVIRHIVAVKRDSKDKPETPVIIKRLIVHVAGGKAPAPTK